MTDFQLAKTITFTSPFSFEESLSRLNAQNRYMMKVHTTNLYEEASMGIRFELLNSTPSQVKFALYKLASVKRHPDPLMSSREALLGGIILQGTLTRREDGKSDVSATSRIDRWNFDRTTVGFQFLVIVSCCLPCMVIGGPNFSPWAAIPISMLAVAATLYFWYRQVIALRDELINHLKWTLHGALVDLS